MNPRSLLLEAAAHFRAAGIPDPENDSALLLSFLTGQTPLSLRLNSDTELSTDIVESFHAMAERRLAREPLQYITGEAPFYGRIFQVDSRVLIPRPETEELCAWALDSLPVSMPCRVLDLCCGSGCIGLTLAAERPSLQVTLSDCSQDSLDVAASNAARFGLQISLHRGDLSEGLPSAFFHCIVSNPPYIPSAECRILQPEVLREPILALDGGADGLVFYRRISDESIRILKPGGILLLELGYGEADAVSSLLASAGFTGITVKKDFRGIARMILAVSPARRNYV